MDFHLKTKDSVIFQNWQYLLGSLALIYCANLVLKRAQDRKECKNETKTAHALDGEEAVGAQLNNPDKQSDPTDSEAYEYTPALEDKPHIPYHGATVTLPRGAAQFYEMVKNRRSVRSFSAAPVPLEVLETCIHAAGTAPSGAHTEPWTFCIVKDMQIKRQIRDIVEAEELLNYSQRMHRQWTTDLKPLKTNHIKPYLTVAPYLVLIFKQTYGLPGTEGQKRRQHYYHEISVAIATGILLCALQSAGLCSLVTTPLNCGPALRLLLKRPVNEKLMALLPVGYAAEDCEVPDFKRKDLEDIAVVY